METTFEKQGIQFKIINEDLMVPVCDFMWEYFFPDEPVSRSLNIIRHPSMDDEILKDAMEDGSSMAAIDKNGAIIGVRIGKRKKKSQWTLKMFEKHFDSLPDAVVSTMSGNTGMPTYRKLLALVGFDVWKMFAELGCDQIYEDVGVCSARFSGVKGLGTELVRRTDLLAKELGATHTYAAVTGTL